MDTFTALNGMPGLSSGMTSMGGAGFSPMGFGMGASPLGGMSAMQRCCGGMGTSAADMLSAEAAMMTNFMQMLLMLMMQLMAGRAKNGGLPGMPGAIPGGPGGSHGAGGGSNGGGGAAGAKDTGGSGSMQTNNSLNPETVTRQGKPIGANIAGGFDRMVAAAKQDGVDLKIESGYRSHAEQVKLWNQYGQNPARVARPGTSNHEKGNAIDFSDTPGAFAWLKKNAEKFGFHNYPPEPWHYSTDGH